MKMYTYMSFGCCICPVRDGLISRIPNTRSVRRDADGCPSEIRGGAHGNKDVICDGYSVNESSSRDNNLKQDTGGPKQPTLLCREISRDLVGPFEGRDLLNKIILKIINCLRYMFYGIIWHQYRAITE